MTVTSDLAPVDDHDLGQAMHVVDDLTAEETRALICSSVQAALSYARTGDVSHVTGHARNLLGTLELRRHPEYVEAVRRPATRPGGPTVAIADVLARLQAELT